MRWIFCVLLTPEIIGRPVGPLIEPGEVRLGEEALFGARIERRPGSEADISDGAFFLSFNSGDYRFGPRSRCAVSMTWRTASRISGS
jgi:hypothetical protein